GVRLWDKAATAGDGDFTAGILMSKTTGGQYFVEDVVRGQWGSGERDQVILKTAQSDAKRPGSVAVWVEQEPGSSGKDSAQATVRLLAGFPVRYVRATGEKVVRADPFAAQAEAGNVKA